MSVMPRPFHTPSCGRDSAFPGSCGHGVSPRCQLLSEPRSIVLSSPQDVSALHLL